MAKMMSNIEYTAVSLGKISKTFETQDNFVYGVTSFGKVVIKHKLENRKKTYMHQLFILELAPIACSAGLCQNK